jgi:hypothetical protein
MTVITVTRNSPLISTVQRKRPGEYWIHGGSFIGGGGGGRRATAEEAADYMSQSPHWAVLMKLTKELGWEDGHRFLGLTKYGFVPMRLPIPPTYADNGGFSRSSFAVAIPAYDGLRFNGW